MLCYWPKVTLPRQKEAHTISLTRGAVHRGGAETSVNASLTHYRLPKLNESMVNFW